MAKVYYLHESSPENLKWFYDFIKTVSKEMELHKVYDLSQADISRDEAMKILTERNSKEKIGLVVPLSNDLAVSILEAKKVLNPNVVVFIFNNLVENDKRVVIALENADVVPKKPEILKAEIKVIYTSSDRYLVEIDRKQLENLYPADTLEESLEKAIDDLGSLEGLKDKGIMLKKSLLSEVSSSDIKLLKIVESE